MKNTTPKTIALFAILSFSLISCSENKPSRDEIVLKNAEDHLQTIMNDPKSYEFVSLTLADSVLYSDNIQSRKEYFTENIEYDSDNLKRKEAYKIEIPSLYNEKEIEDLKSRIAKNVKVIEEIDDLEAKLGDKKNHVASFTYTFSFRGSNALGAKVLSEYIVQTTPSPDYKIINMTDDQDKVFLNPNDFPGYIEMIKKYL